MSSRKISEVRVNINLGIVQIKFNRGANMTLKGAHAAQFIRERDKRLDCGTKLSDANYLTAVSYIPIPKKELAA